MCIIPIFVDLLEFCENIGNIIGKNVKTIIDKLGKM